MELGDLYQRRNKCLLPSFEQINFMLVLETGYDSVWFEQEAEESATWFLQEDVYSSHELMANRRQRSMSFTLIFNFDSPVSSKISKKFTYHLTEIDDQGFETGTTKSKLNDLMNFISTSIRKGRQK